MNVELVAQMFKNYQSNVLFHLEGQLYGNTVPLRVDTLPSYGQSQRANLAVCERYHYKAMSHEILPVRIARRMCHGAANERGSHETIRFVPRMQRADDCYC